jgi:hypothetical protein
MVPIERVMLRDIFSLLVIGTRFYTFGERMSIRIKLCFAAPPFPVPLTVALLIGGKVNGLEHQHGHQHAQGRRQADRQVNLAGDMTGILTIVF